MEKPEIVFGWCGQAASPGHSIQVLKNQLQDYSKIDYMVEKSLDFLSSYPVVNDCFSARYIVESKTFTQKDTVSMGRGMYNMARAIETARKNKQYNTLKWEESLQKVYDVTSKRILDNNWVSRSTAEGFYIRTTIVGFIPF